MAKKAKKRCKSTDEDTWGSKKTKISVPAEVACPVACDAACDDDLGDIVQSCEDFDLPTAVETFLEDPDLTDPIIMWDVSCITTMAKLFEGASSFNADVSISVEIKQWPRPAWEVLFIIFDRVVVSLAPR